MIRAATTSPSGPRFAAPPPLGRTRRLLFAAALTAVLLAVLTAGPASAATVGFQGPSYSGASSEPTGSKPQSKLWVTPDRIWWANMWNSLTGRYEIHRLDRSTRKWVPTGTATDARGNSKADAMWDGQHLYLATAGPSASASGDSARLLRYTYDPASRTYALDPGFPHTLTAGGMLAVVMEKDTTGRLWITYTRAGKVYVSHSTTSDTTWTAPYVLPVAGAANLLGEDISAVVSFNGKIGVMWSNQVDGAMYFASHLDGQPDGAWTAGAAIKEPEIADDHINLKSLQADERGQVYAATKTSLNTATAPLTLLLVLDNNGNWQRHTFGRVQDDHTRPMVTIDRGNDTVYVMASSPCCGGGKVYYKKSSLRNISFSSGLGTLFMEDGTGAKVNNVSGTKQEVTADTDIVALAGVESRKLYWHNELDLASATPDLSQPETTIDSGPEGTVETPSASFAFSANEPGVSFECSLDGATFGSCSSPKAYADLPNGTHTFAVRAIDGSGNVDATPATRTWTVNAVVAATMSVPAAADAYVAERKPDLNFGTGLRLSNDDGSGNDEHSYLRFDVSGVSRPIVSAKVRAYVANGSVNAPAIHPTAASWNETGLTWASRPLAAGPAADDKGAVTTGSYVEYDVTPLVTGNGAHGFVTLPGSTDGFDLASREDANAARRPTLELELGG